VEIPGLLRMYTNLLDIQTSDKSTMLPHGKTTREMKMLPRLPTGFSGDLDDSGEHWLSKAKMEVYGLPAMVPTTIEKLSGDGKCSPAGSKLAVPLSVRVKNQDDEAMFDVQVEFTVTARRRGGTALNVTTPVVSPLPC